MLLYEHDRTELIIAGLTKVAAAMRYFSVLGSMTALGAVFSLLGAAVAAEGWWVVGLFGALIGIFLGLFVATLARVILEWMAQSLVAQGELLAAMKKRV